jgi:hypothetical protein
MQHRNISAIEHAVNNFKKLFLTLQNNLDLVKDSFLMFQDDSDYIQLWTEKKGVIGLVDSMTLKMSDIEKAKIKQSELE